MAHDLVHFSPFFFSNFLHTHKNQKNLNIFHLDDVVQIFNTHTHTKNRRRQSICLFHSHSKNTKKKIHFLLLFCLIHCVCRWTQTFYCLPFDCCCKYTLQRYIYIFFFWEGGLLCVCVSFGMRVLSSGHNRQRAKGVSAREPLEKEGQSHPL